MNKLPVKVLACTSDVVETTNVEKVLACTSDVVETTNVEIETETETETR